MAKIKDDRYIYISTRIKMRRGGTLTGDDLVRMARAATGADAAKVLLEKGFEPFDPSDPESLERSLSARRAEILELLYSYAPDRRVIDVFKLKDDYHNIKVCIKDLSHADLMSDAGTVPASTVADAALNKKWSLLPPDMARAAKDAADSAMFDTQKADIMLDSAMCAQMLATAVETKSRFLLGYVRLYIDTLNLKIAVRALRAGRSAEFIAGCFIAGGTPITEDVKADPSEIASLFKGGVLYSVAVQGLNAGGSLAALDRGCDNLLLDYIRSSRAVNYGEAHVISYLLGSEAEISAARLVISGRMSGIPADKIIERLRDI